jgi:hypothetical protein
MPPSLTFPPATVWNQKPIAMPSQAPMYQYFYFMGNNTWEMVDLPQSQRDGLNYTETFSSVIRMASFRFFLAIAAARDLELCHFDDIDNALIYAPIKEDVYICQPLGFSDGTYKVCHLKSCRYGLKQSLREFTMLPRAWLVDNGCQQ